jgi:tetratricopeptide (TPR) repeat protein
VALSERAWQTADREGDRGAAYAATFAGCDLFFRLHDVKEGLRWLQRELGRPRAAQSPLLRELIALLMSAGATQRGDLTEARRLSPHTDWRFLQGRLLFLEGKWEEAEELLENEIVELRRVGDLLPASNCAVIRASVLRVRGAVRQAALVLGEAVESSGEANVNNEMRIRPLLSLANAELGQYDAAERELAYAEEWEVDVDEAPLPDERGGAGERVMVGALAGATGSAGAVRAGSVVGPPTAIAVATRSSAAPAAATSLPPAVSPALAPSAAAVAVPIASWTPRPTLDEVGVRSDP